MSNKKFEIVKIDKSVKFYKDGIELSAYKEVNFPYIEKMAEEWADKYYNRNSDSVSAITESLEWENRKYNFIEGFKANNHLDELEKWVKENEEYIETQEGYGDVVWVGGLIREIKRLKTFKP